MLKMNLETDVKNVNFIRYMEQQQKRRRRKETRYGERESHAIPGKEIRKILFLKLQPPYTYYY